jgi:hypothetical protein
VCRSFVKLGLSESCEDKKKIINFVQLDDAGEIHTTFVRDQEEG